jgi:mannitol-1-phosphate/altronate dehydrogenase
MIMRNGETLRGRMTELQNKTFVGFGFGPIQSALFLYEAYMSGNFTRFVVSEIDQALVDAVRNNGGIYHLNIARKNRIDDFHLEDIELYNPRSTSDKDAILEAVVSSDEMAVALPSVNIYDIGGENSVAGLIAQGLRQRQTSKPTVIYASENNNHAAEILREKIEQYASPQSLDKVEVLNTVIGKMSGVITEPEVISRMGLAPVTPALPRAILVEEFNRILISRIQLENYQRGIECFMEKDDLLPFEEAKLYGHNAIHALIAYLADLKGLATVADAGPDEWIMSVARRAFIEESGGALIQRHAELDDPLFTPQGYRDYAEDLLERMVNPNLNDLVARVGRDHQRKLGYDDRIYGTMHLALEAGIEPVNLALGGAAGVVSMIKRRQELPEPPEHLPEDVTALNEAALATVLNELWNHPEEESSARLIALTWNALEQLRQEGLLPQSDIG